VAYKLWSKWCDRLLKGDSLIIGVSWSIGPTNKQVILYKQIQGDNWLAELSEEEEEETVCYYQKAYRNQVLNLMV
jgi:hypothetical protein